MASIHKEVLIEAQPDAVWGAVRDVGAVHLRVAPGFLTGCRMDDTPGAPRSRIGSKNTAATWAWR